MSTTDATERQLTPGGCPDDGVQVLEAREVPLGGPRGLTVRRTLPHRDRSFVGAWCFVDHYGPDAVGETGGMDVPPHPHTGLQTVSWLFEGEIEHRDSGGVVGLVRPGEVNLMTAGGGICHSETSTATEPVLHGAQLWVVLPEADRGVARRFDHHAAEPGVITDGVVARVFVGELAGQPSPVPTYTPLLGAQLDIEAGTRASLPVDPTYEHAVLVDTGDVTFCGRSVPRGGLGIVDPGRDRLDVECGSDARLLLLGGVPFDEEIVMWWNFIGRDHDDVAQMREQWQQHAERFGEVDGYDGDTPRLEAPPFPRARLKPRGRQGKR